MYKIKFIIIKVSLQNLLIFIEILNFFINIDQSPILDNWIVLKLAISPSMRYKDYRLQVSAIGRLPWI